MAGFIAASEGGAVTTLGRGGSDYTATLVGAALGAREVQIWTDVAGVLTADPHIVKGARTIPWLSYAEAATLAFFGAKVLHPKTIEPLVGQRIPLRVCNSRAPEEPGTLVCAGADSSPHTDKAITHQLGANGGGPGEAPRHGPIVERGRALICMVGGGLREAPAVAARVAHALTNMNALFVKHEVSDVLLLDVDEDRSCEAVTRLHAAFF